MKNLSCPAYISALIHFHCTPEPIRDAPVNHKAIREFLNAGLIAPEENGRYRTTPLGSAYVAALCLVPPPVQCFRDAAGNAFDQSGEICPPTHHLT